ncbi:MAG: hypothetical protein WA003_08765 [Desulfuromonadaceae bacterium]
MPNSSITEAQHVSLVRNQELFSTGLIERINTLGLGSRFIMDNPVIHPALRPALAIDTSLVQLARGNFANMRQALLSHMGFYYGCKPLIEGIRLGWDVRPRIADEIVFLIWYQRMHILGYRYLTEKAASELHNSETSIFLQSWLERYYSTDYQRSRKIRHAVKLVCPQQQIVDGYEHTKYCLEAAYSRKEYKFSILAASEHDTTMQGLWLFKPSSWKKSR